MMLSEMIAQYQMPASQELTQSQARGLARSYMLGRYGQDTPALASLASTGKVDYHNLCREIEYAEGTVARAYHGELSALRAWASAYVTSQ